MTVRTPIGAMVERLGADEPWRPSDSPEIIRVTAAEVIRAEMAVYSPPPCDVCGETECLDAQRCADLGAWHEGELAADLGG